MWQKKAVAKQSSQPANRNHNDATLLVDQTNHDLGRAVFVVPPEKPNVLTVGTQTTRKVKEVLLKIPCAISGIERAISKVSVFLKRYVVNTTTELSLDSAFLCNLRASQQISCPHRRNRSCF